MRTPLEIIADLKNTTYWSQPNLKYTETMNLLNELEVALTPIEEVTPEPTEEFNEDISESISNILSLLETGAVEEPIVEEVVAPKKRPRKV